ncbi:MAG: BatD family protein [Alistipes indistinctus]
MSGNGNLPLIQAPKVTMPSSFEQYNMKTTESLTHNGNGITGYRQFDYPFIPRAEGSYSVGPVEFSYFDPEQAKYVTLSAPQQNVEIKPDSTGGTSAGTGVISGVSKEDLKILDKDIRFIRIGEPQFHRRGHLYFGSWAYWLALAVLTTITAALYFYLRKHLKELQNTSLVRHKRANKVALQRLKAALGYMTADEEKPFYEEMLKALWGYMSDKLNIPVANLTKDNIREELLKRSVDAEYINRFIEIISDCEYAQYSPSSSGQMTEIYNGAVKMLSKFESLIKSKVDEKVFICYGHFTRHRLACNGTDARTTVGVGQHGIHQRKLPGGGKRLRVDSRTGLRKRPTLPEPRKRLFQTRDDRQSHRQLQPRTETLSFG